MVERIIYTEVDHYGRYRVAPEASYTVGAAIASPEAGRGWIKVHPMRSRRKPVVFVEYDPAWPEVFQGLAGRVSVALGVPGREAFMTPRDLPPHHLYVCAADSRELHRHLSFRDYLRAHPVDTRAYGTLKQAAAARFPDDITAYMAAKDGLIKDILSRA